MGAAAAVAAGAAVNIVVIAGGSIAMGEQPAYGSLIIGSLVAVIFGFILEFFFFSVDYARSESLQFEDDEYYYYVKAVPKLFVSGQEKTIKKINYYQEDEDAGKAIRFSPKEMMRKKKNPKKGPAIKTQNMDDVDEILLAQSLNDELE